MRLEDFAEDFDDEDVTYVEIVIYRNKNGKMVREVFAVDYYGDEDFQWSRSTKPLQQKEIRLWQIQQTQMFFLYQ